MEKRSNSLPLAVPDVHVGHGTLVRRRTAANTAFAGRIGGNQEFTVSQDDTEAEEVLKQQPDAAPLYSIKDSLNPHGFLVWENWKSAIIEGWATFLLVFVVGLLASGLSSLPPTTSPIAIALVASLGNLVGLSLFIYAAGPASGGHINPTISMATFFAGLSTLPRSVLYIIAQSIGAIISGYWLRLALGDAYFPNGVIPGCTVDPKLVSPGQMFVLEFITSQALVFVAFGVGLDPRQARVFGPALAPILVGFSLAIGTLVTAFAKPGYTGASLNPARCLGLMVAKGEMGYHYVHWLGPLCTSMVNGAFYYFAPPYFRDKKKRQY